MIPAWLKYYWRGRKQTETIKVSRPRPAAIRLDQWRHSPVLTTDARRVLDMPLTKAMLDVLYAESPSNYQLASLGIRAEDRAALQAKTEGYHMCLDFLESLGVPVEDDRAPLEATFESPEVEPK